MSLSVLQAAGGPAEDNTTTSVRAFGANVAVGSRAIVAVVSGEVRGTSSSDFVAGSCVKSAGTATIGAITLDKTVNVLDATAGLFCRVGLWSAAVTGAGSLTYTITCPGGTSQFWNTSYAELADSGGTVAVGGTASGNNGGTASTAPSTGAITPGAFQSIAVAGVSFVGSGGTETVTEAGGFTLIDKETDSSLHTVGSTIRDTTALTVGTSTPAWTLGASHIWCAAGVAYTGTGGGAAVQVPYQPGYFNAPAAGY